MIDADEAFLYSIEENQKNIYRKYTSITISKGHLFAAYSNNSTRATVKNSSATDEEATCDLAKGSKVIAKTQSSPSPDRIIDAIEPHRLGAKDLIEDLNDDSSPTTAPL